MLCWQCAGPVNLFNIRKVWVRIFDTNSFAFSPLKLPSCMFYKHEIILELELFVLTANFGEGLLFKFFALKLAVEAISNFLILTTTFSYLFVPIYLLSNPLSTLPAVRHTTSWRKTGKYSRPTTWNKTNLNQWKVRLLKHKLSKTKDCVNFVALWFQQGFPLNKCSLFFATWPIKTTECTCGIYTTYARVRGISPFWLKYIWTLHLSYLS